MIFFTRGNSMERMFCTDPIPSFSLLLPDIRSGFNVGAFFRTCDALRVDHIYLTGISPYPPHKEIQKTALGAEYEVSWSYHLDAVKLLGSLKERGVQLAALEISPSSISLTRYSPESPLVLIVGNEVHGIPKEILRLADHIISIPMGGVKESLNVSIAGSIALWEIAKRLKEGR